MANSTVTRFLATVADGIERHRMLAPGDHVLVAVSGGPDSVALLHALLRLAPAWPVHLSVAHLHHGLRGAAADADACRVAELARRLGLPWITDRVDTAAEARHGKLSLETAGRRLRYGFLSAAADRAGCRRIALGHQRNDNAELVLMNLIRGTGPLGLAAMPPLRDDRYIRPLLEIDRRQILDFLGAIGADYSEDETNRHLNHTRNWVRQVLLPLIANQANPAIVSALNRTAAIFRDEESWLASITQRLFSTALQCQEPGRVVLDASVLRALAPAARRRVLRCALVCVHPDRHSIRWAHIEAIAALLTAAPGQRRLHLPHRIEVLGEWHRIELRRRDAPLRRPRPESSFRYAVAGPGHLAIPEMGLAATIRVLSTTATDTGLSAGQWSAFFDMDVVSFPLVVRSTAPGDRFRPLGAGGTQKVNKFLTDHKVPQHLRRNYPVVESRGRIVWLAGQRIAQAVAANAASRRVLSMVIRPADASTTAHPARKEPDK